MKLHKSAVGAAMVAAALMLGAGTTHAEPAPAPAETINYAVQLLEKTVVTTLKGGTFSIVEKEGDPATGGTPDGKPIAEEAKGKIVEIRDDKGALVVSMPLDFTANGIAIPVKSEVKKDGAVLEITPEKPAALDTSRPLAVQAIASPIENQRAQSEFASNFGIATAVGGFVGTAIGAIVGCIATIVAGCVPGLITGAGVGGILGTIAVGGPTLVASGIELVNTLQAPAGSTKWADGGKPQNAEAPK